MDCSTPGVPVHHQPPEHPQTHVHQVGEAIQLSHLLSSPSPPTFNLSQYQGLFQWVSSLYQVDKVLELQLQHSSFNEYSGLISFRMDWLDLLVVQGLSGKESACQCRRCWFSPWIGEENSTHSSTLAWEIPRTEEPVGIQSQKSQTWLSN